MQRQAVNSKGKEIWWRDIAPTAAYALVFCSAAVFIFMIFRDVQLIGSYQRSVNPWSYAEIHTYIVLVEIVLWTIMAKASLRLIGYTRKIVHSQDGKALHYIAVAVLLSLAYAILFDMASTFKTLFMRTSHLGAVTTFTNLLPLAIFLLLSLLLFVGSYKLKRLLPDSPAQLQRNRYIVILSLAAFLLVVIPFAEYFYRAAPLMLDDDGLHHFALSASALTIVYVLPFAIIWLLGVLSSLNLAQYGNRVRGKLYRPMFRKLYLGILLSYTSTYLIQIFYVSNVPTNRFGIGFVSIMALIFMIIAGYILMYRGADELNSLEQ